ncbi:MAG: carbohydrate ABC transporter permease, partial [Clostridiales bacterium]|nr:carbohydrate ABC transporter permease [Clostridiales bacterium]
GVPREIEEAALIDGAGALRTYTMVMLPNAGAPAITVTMFAFVWQYNDVFYASMFGGRLSLISIKIATLSSTLSAMLRMFDANEVSLNVNAGLLLVIAPLVVVYLLLQRRFMQGVERSGIVG